MSDTTANASKDISSVLVEQRSFPPPAGFAAAARLKAEDLAELHRRAAADPVGYWAELARAELAWRKGAGTVLELLDALRQLRALQIEALQARLDDDRADAAARAEMLTAAAAADPVFGESLRLRPTTPDAPK